MVKALRAAQIADQIRDYVAQWVARDLVGVFVSVTQVTLAPSGERAIIWISTFRPEDRTVAVKKIKASLPEYQRNLYREIPRHRLPALEVRLEPLRSPDEDSFL